MAVSTHHSYEVYARVDNFRNSSQKLDFGEFTILQLSQGREAAEWRRKLNSRRVPQHVIIYPFPTYSPREDDVSGFDGIMNTIMDTLLCFRLFRVGDIAFNDMVIRDTQTDEQYLSLYRVDDISHFTYSFSEDDVNTFNSFQKEIIHKPGFRNEFFVFAVSFFMSGVDRRFFYNMHDLRRIIDYVIALESLFLVGGNTPFLRSTIARCISEFLKDTKCAKTVKAMYDERSNIVHGNNLGLTPEDKAKVLARIKEHMPAFEALIRLTLRELLTFDFKTKDEIRDFMESLYKLPEAALQTMAEAQKKAVALIQSHPQAMI